MMTISRTFLKEIRVAGQICREGMDESGILLKARYAVTVCHCLEQLVVGGRGAVSRSVDPGQSPGGGFGGSDSQVHNTKRYPQKQFFGTFLSVCCIQIERRNSFKLKKFMCKANISTSCSVNISKCISW